MPPLYKHTMTPPCCHSTEQCTSAEYEQKNCTNIQKLRLRSVIGGMGKQEQDRKESGAIVEWPYRLSLWQGHYWTLGTHTHSHTIRHTQRDSPNSPTGSVGEHYVAFLIGLFNESYTCLFLPVTHGLLKHGPLSTWNTHISHPTFTQSHVRACFSVRYRQQSSRVTYQWSFPLWRREWLPQAISSQLGMWPLGEYGFSWHSQSSHLFQFGSWDWQLPWWSSLGGSLTERGQGNSSQIYLLPQVVVRITWAPQNKLLVYYHEYQLINVLRAYWITLFLIIRDLFKFVLRSDGNKTQRDIHCFIIHLF